MKLRYLPDYTCVHPEEIHPEYFKWLGVKLIICDLDNTLAKAQSYVPSQDIKAWVNSLKEAGLEIAVASNGKKERVEVFGTCLGVPNMGLSLKPFSFRIKRFAKELGYKKDEVLLIGDQMFTDVKAAKRAGFKCILCETVSEKESKFTCLNRKRDIEARDIIQKDRLVPNWRER